MKHLPQNDSKQKGDEEDPAEQKIPEEVLKQLPPEVRAQLGYVEEQQPIFKPPPGAGSDLSNSIDRLREGFEKIGLTLIGRMGEFASTLERVVMTVARIEKVENQTAEVTYFLKNLQKTLDGFSRDVGKVLDKVDNVTLDIEQMKRTISELKAGVVIGAPVQVPTHPRAPPSPVMQPPAPQPPVAHPLPPQPPVAHPIAPQQPVASPVAQPTPPVTPVAEPIIEAPSAPEQEEIPEAAGSIVNNLFSNLQVQIKVGVSSNSMADLLDSARETISKECKWSPAIYEIGKSARQLRKSNTKMTEKDVNELNKSIEQWKKQISQT